MDVRALPVLVDPLLPNGEEPFATWLSPWPIRFFVIDDSSGVLQYASVPQAATFDHVLGDVAGNLQAEHEGVMQPSP